MNILITAYLLFITLFIIFFTTEKRIKKRRHIASLYTDNSHYLLTTYLSATYLPIIYFSTSSLWMANKDVILKSPTEFHSAPLSEQD